MTLANPTLSNSLNQSGNTSLKNISRLNYQTFHGAEMRYAARNTAKGVTLKQLTNISKQPILDKLKSKATFIQSGKIAFFNTLF